MAIVEMERIVERCSRPVRRRGTAAQGQALEVLGHAVEYLIDSRMWGFGSGDPSDDREATQILMRKSREVFAECQEVRSLRERLTTWVRRSSQRDGLVG